MKKSILTITFCLLLTSIFAQTMNPKEYAVITKETLRGKPSYGYPRIDWRTTEFTPNGDFLFILDSDADTDGNLVVYDVTQKKVVKRFKMKKTGIYFPEGKMLICNPNNPNQLALHTNKSTVKVIQNWQTAPEDILLQKTSENVVTIKAKVDKGQMAFSKDGKNLYFIENETKIIKSAELASGVITKKILPDGKLPRIWFDFIALIGNDEVVVYNESIYANKGKPGIPHNIEIFNLVTNSVVRKYELSDLFDSPYSNSCGNPHIIILGRKKTLNVLTGETVNSYETIIKSIKKIDKDAKVELHQIPGIGFVGNYYINEREEKNYGSFTSIKTKTGYGLFFYDKSGNDVFGDFPSVNSKIPLTNVGYLQISPNGKYIIFHHEGGDNMDNTRTVIATLY